MIDVKGICDGLAARFAPGTITRPSGADAMHAAIGQMPKTVGGTPYTYVEPTDGGVIAADGGIWQHEMHLDVVTLFGKRPGDPARVEKQRQLWLPALLAATEGKLKIGIGVQTGYEVRKAIPTGWTWDEVAVDAVLHDAIRVHYAVYVGETVSLVA